MATPLPGNRTRTSDIFTVTTFTPTWNFTVGTGATNEGWYAQIGELVHWGVRVQLGTSPTSSGTTSVLLDLPVDAWTGGGNGLQAVLGTFNYRDASGPSFYAGSANVFASAGTQACFILGSSTTRLSPTNPVAFAVDDVIAVGGTYMAQ